MKIFDRIINKFWRSIVWPKASIKIHDVVFKVPRVQHNNFYKASYQTEPWLEKILLNIDRTNKINTFIDIGVNIGQTLLKIKSINKDVQYIGFEPNPFCCTVVNKIISINDMANCSLVPCGLGEKPDLLKLSLTDSDDLLDSSASLVEGFRNQQTIQKQFVTVFPLDNFIKSFAIQSIDVIKIDIEGSEMEAIRGMKETLKSYKPIILLEVLPSYDVSNKSRFDRQLELALILKNLGYQIFQIKNKEKEMEFKHVLEFPVHKNVHESDYLLLPDNINLSEVNL